MTDTLFLKYILAFTEVHFDEVDGECHFETRAVPIPIIHNDKLEDIVNYFLSYHNQINIFSCGQNVLYINASDYAYRYHKGVPNFRKDLLAWERRNIDDIWNIKYYYLRKQKDPNNKNKYSIVWDRKE